jgi:hypothetical protein
VQATAFRMRMRVGHRVTSVTSVAMDQRTARTFVRRGALIRMVLSPVLLNSRKSARKVQLRQRTSTRRWRILTAVA